MNTFNAKFLEVTEMIPSNSLPSNVPTAFFGSETPWHGKMTPLSKEAQTDWRAALEETKLDFEPQLVEQICPVTGSIIPNRWNLYRFDGSKAYMLNNGVSDIYTPFRVSQALEFLIDIVGNDYKLDSIGALNYGSTIFANVKAATFDVEGQQYRLFKQFVLGYDGKHPLTALDSSINIVCSNTCRHALDKANSKLSFRNTTNGTNRLANAKAILAIAGQNAQTFKEKLELLSRKGLTNAVKLAFYERFIPASVENGKLDYKRKDVSVIESQSPNVAGTWHGLLNMVTAAYSHSDGMAESMKIGKVSSDTRNLAMFGNSLFGTYADKKTEALNILLDLAR